MHTKLITQGPAKAATSSEVFKVAVKKDEQEASPLSAQQQEGNEVLRHGSLWIQASWHRQQFTGKTVR
jgi:hypothetical protein